jgi:uncharacterized integral membrane protein
MHHRYRAEGIEFVMTGAHNQADRTTGPIRAEQGKNTHPGRSKTGRSRAGGLWVASVLFALILLLLLIFMLENGQRVDVAFFGMHAYLPMGVALLLAAVFGILLVALPGTARILQLRMRDHRRITAPAPAPAPEQTSPSADTRQETPTDTSPDPPA